MVQNSKSDSSFADDSSIGCSNTDDLKSVNEFMMVHGSISGLSVNTDKTNICHNLPLEEEEREALRNMGFRDQRVSTSVNYLGFVISASKNLNIQAQA